jgi:predicted Zn-dependent protease
MDRLAMLQQVVGQKPDDPFPRYALAMEHRKHGQHEDAWASFSTLIENHPTYIATYLMAGNVLVEMDRGDEARAVLDRGIAVAVAAGDAHAQSELEAARAALS